MVSRSPASQPSTLSMSLKTLCSSSLVLMTLVMPPFFMTMRRQAMRASMGSCVTTTTIFPSPESRRRASCFLMPAFSISSMSTIGESLITAMSAAMRARDWPPLRMVSWKEGSTGSPVRVLAMAITLSARSGSLPLDLACILKNSHTDMSARKCIFWESWATSFFLGSHLSSAAGGMPLMRILRPDGVSSQANCSMSAMRVLLPEPVGPTIPIISPLDISISETASGRPSLSTPP